MKLLLVSSAGGHLAQLLLLEPFWSRHERTWVTLDKPDARARLQGERVVYAHGPTNRAARVAVRNIGVARRVIRQERPDVVISNGAGVAVPFFLAAAARGIPTVFFEVYDRIDRPSLTGRLLAPIATAVVAQWPDQLEAYPDARLLGPML